MPAPPAARDLPPEVRDLALRCGADPTAAPSAQATFHQTGTMRADAAHPWAPFRARQTMAIDRPGFAWRAATGPLGCTAITDALTDAGAALTVRAFGLIPLAHVASDDALIKGQLLRYLAELPIAPDAILHNPHLDWTVVSPTVLRVAGAHRGVRAALELTLGPDGLVASTFAADRPRVVGARVAEQPWAGRFSEYRLHAGRRMPFAAEVAWIEGGVEVPVWRGAMTGWALA